MSDMTISDGLKLLKEKRAELLRIIALQKEKFTVTIPVETKSLQGFSDADHIPFGSLESKISHLKQEIANLRFALDQAAHETTVKMYVSPSAQEVKLAFLRLAVEEARADIDRIQTLQSSRGKGYAFGERRKRLTVDDKEREVYQLDDLELESLLKSKIALKTRLESLLEKANVNTRIAPYTFPLTP